MFLFGFTLFPSFTRRIATITDKNNLSFCFVTILAGREDGVGNRVPAGTYLFTLVMLIILRWLMESVDGRLLLYLNCVIDIMERHRNA